MTRYEPEERRQSGVTRPYRDAAWLRHQYEALERPAHAIAADFGISGTAILAWLAKHGVPRRTTKDIRARKYWRTDQKRRPRAPKPPRPILVVREIARVPLTRGAVAIIDARDVHLVEGRNWRLFLHEGRRYAAGVFIEEDGTRRSRTMHRVILAPPDGMMTDHIDGNGLNNRRSNLCPATAEQNAWNSARPTTNKSGFKGVSWSKSRGVWRATIKHHGRQVYLGIFDDPEVAHQAYKEAAIRFRGEFARFE